MKSLRIVLLWQNVAPAATSRIKPDFDATDPAKYNWSAYDPQVDGAVARGWKVLLTVSGPVPRWATNGAKDNVTRPKPKEFQAFMTAAARHFGAEDLALVDLERAQPAAVPPAAVLRREAHAAVAADLPQALPRRRARHSPPAACRTRRC